MRVGRVRDAVYYRYPDRDVLVLFYGCAIIEGEPVALECNAIAWATPEALPGYDFAGADLAFVKRNYGNEKTIQLYPPADLRRGIGGAEPL